MSEFSEALSDYQTKAQELIDETINGIETKYQEKYDALIEKQNTLISKLKSAGELVCSINWSAAGKYNAERV